MKGHIIFNGRYTSKGAVRFVEKGIWKGKGLDLEAYWNVDELNAPRMAIFNFTLTWTQISLGNYPRIVQCQWEILLMLTLNKGSEHYLTMFARLEIEVRIISCFSVSSSFLTMNCLLTGTPSAPGRHGDNWFGSVRGVRWLPVKLNWIMSTVVQTVGLTDLKFQ